MHKDYRRIESKKRVRRRAKEFVKKYIHLFGGPQNVRYFTLLGTSDRELVEVTDPLGIPRENIICAENNKRAQNYIKKQGWGVDLFEGDALDFLLNTEEKLDIINLDYQGYFHGKSIAALRAIPLRQILKPKGILMTNFLGSREKDKDVYYSYLTESMLNHEGHEKYHKTLDEMTTKWDFDKDFQIKPATDFVEDDIDFEKLRDYGITSNIISIFINGIEHMPPQLIETVEFDEKLKDLTSGRFGETIFEALPDYNEISGEIREEIKENINYIINLIDGGMRIKKFGEKPLYYNPVPGADEYKMPIMSDFIIGKGPQDDLRGELSQQLFKLDEMSDRNIMNRYYYAFARYKSEFLKFISDTYDKPMQSEIAKYLEKGFRAMDRKAYFERDLERYKYQSDANSLMFTDFFFFDQFEDHNEKLKEALVLDENNQLFYFDGPKFQKVYNSSDSKILHNLARLKLEDYPVRRFMGSSYKPKLSGKRYYELLCKAKRKSQDEKIFHEGLLDDFRTNRNQLTAFNMHTKRGTYGEVPSPKTKRLKIPEREFKIRDVINSENPYKFYNRFPGYVKQRLDIFLQEDLPYRIQLAQEEKGEMLSNISKSRWFKEVLSEDIEESRIYNFFDDLMLYTTWNRKGPGTKEIKEIYRNSGKGLKDLSFKPEQKQQNIPKGAKIEGNMPKGKPYIDKQEAVNLLKIGTPVEEIVSGYRGFSGGQLRAFKAHITMGTYDDGKPRLEKEEAYKLLKRGWDYNQIKEVYKGVNKNQIRAYKAWITMRERDGLGI